MIQCVWHSAFRGHCTGKVLKFMRNVRMRGIPKNILRSSQYCQTVTILTRRVGGWGKCGTRVRYSACSPPAQYRSPKWKTKAKSSREEPESSEFSIGKAASLHATCSTPSSKTTESLLLLQCHSSNTYRRRQCHYYPRRTTNVKSHANSSTSCRCFTNIRPLPTA